jgi:hypothetical protein
VASRGTGGSFGRALINALADAADGVVGVRRSYTAKGWHAQISKLTSSPRGYEAAAKVGLSATERTLKGWLAQSVEPNAANRAKIQAAYDVMRGRWPEGHERQDIEITGTIKIADDERDRGDGTNAAFLVDGRQGNWDRMRRAWESGEELDDDEWEEWFVEDVMEADLGEFSTAPEFPGGSYTVTLG